MIEIRERLAKEIHSIWSHWMKHLFSKAVWRDGEHFIPKESFDRWWRQMKTPYDLLSEKEKESDRHQADKLLPLLQGTVRDAEINAVRNFYEQVCKRAEAKMEQTHRLEGSHYAAMQEILREWESRG